MTSALFDAAIPTSEGFRDLEPSTVHAHLGQVRVIDVREPHEFVGELGHVPGSLLVPKGTVERTVTDWDRAADLIVVCRSGGRSAAVASVLARLGFARVMNMKGGMLAYNAAGFAVDRSPS